MSELLKCPVCGTDDGEQDGPAVSNVLFYRAHVEKGLIHEHNPNEQAIPFKCKNDHRFKQIVWPKCGTCGWQKYPNRLEPR
jgi:hypothetical protein